MVTLRIMSFGRLGKERLNFWTLKYNKVDVSYFLRINFPFDRDTAVTLDTDT